MPRFSRRSFLHLSAAASAAAAFRVVSEPMLAAAARRRPHAADAVLIDSNENPLGPSQAARDAMAALLPQGGRYSDNLTDELVDIFAKQEGFDPTWIRPTVGSTPALSHAVLAFTSPRKSYVAADPSFEAGWHMAERNGARVVNVPLTASYAHDAKAMVAAGSDAGLFYVCNPNNPTGTVTSHADIEYLVANKPKDSVVLVDEAYIHLSDTAQSALDLVKAGKDVIVLRTFSKAYGMAGIRCGFVIARPDLADKVMERGAENFMPITAVAAATASLKDPQLVPERRHINATVRQQTFQWLDHNGFSYIPSESNCFLLETKRPGQQVRDAMAKENVLIGRVWPIMPTHVRITVGTQEEMERFQTAFLKVMKG
jgi:histidinol-phosphate aminotransferase